MFFPTLIHDSLTVSSRLFPDKAALICAGQTCTYRQLDEQSNQLARWLLQKGIQRGDRVIILLDNSIESVISLYGILKAGGAFVMLNSGLKADKLAYIADNADARFLVTSRFKLETVKQATRNISSLFVVCTDANSAGKHASFIEWNQIFNESADPVNLPEPLIDQDLAALIYTSGSTGLPKGVMQPHGKMLSVAKSIIQYLANTEQDVILNVLSLAFGYSLYQVVMSVIFGGTVILEKSFIYLHDILKKIPQYHVTGFPLVPTILATLFKVQDISQHDFSRLRYVTNAGDALPVAYVRKFRSLWPHISIYPMYGLTECVRVCYLPPEHVDQRPDSVGFAIPNCRVLVEREDGSAALPDEVGQLVIEGTNVMPGYWKDPELTAKVFRPGSHTGQTRLYSGDLFRKDPDGFLYFVSRIGDMIKTRGERVSPKEIESYLCQMPGVAEAAVVGVPDDILGQVPKAFIVCTEGTTLEKKEVLQYAASKLENFMVPKYIDFLTELPKTLNGKIDTLSLKKGIVR